MMARLLPQRIHSLWLQHSVLLVRVGLVAAILAASLILAPRAAMGQPLPFLLVVAPAALLGALAMLKWPEAGFPLLIFAALLVPFSIGTGTQTDINIALLMVGGLTGLWLLDMVAREQRLSLLRSPSVPPMLIFIIVACLSLGFGQLNWLPLSGASFPAQLGGLAVFVMSACAFLVSAHRIVSQRTLQWMVWILIIVGSVYVLGTMMPGPFRRLVNRFFQRAVQDSLFWMWMVALCASQAVINRRLPVVARVALGGLALAVIYVTMVIKQGWTSGWFPALVAAYVIVFLRYPRFAILAGLVGAAGLVISNIFLAGDNAYSLETRLEAWRIVFELIKRSPVLGLGPSNYYFYTPYYSILGYYVKFNSHNNYVDLLAQLGVAGLACYGWFAFQIGRLAWRLRRQVPAGFPRAYVYGVLGGLAGTLVAGMLGDWVLPFVYNVGLAGFRASMFSWLFFGGLVALEQIVQRNQQHASA